MLGIGGDGTFGRLDVLLVDPAADRQWRPIGLFQTQMPRRPARSPPSQTQVQPQEGNDGRLHGHRRRGSPCAGATRVVPRQEAAETAASGTIKLKFPKGSAVGKHVCNATKLLYNIGKTTIKIT